MVTVLHVCEQEALRSSTWGVGRMGGEGGGLGLDF